MQQEKQKFFELLDLANSAFRDASPADCDYLTGYMRGVRRARYGQDYGTNTEHRMWLSFGDRFPDRSAGYRDGLAMKVPRMIAASAARFARQLS